MTALGDVHVASVAVDGPGEHVVVQDHLASNHDRGEAVGPGHAKGVYLARDRDQVEEVGIAGAEGHIADGGKTWQCGLELQHVLAGYRDSVSADENGLQALFDPVGTHVSIDRLLHALVNSLHDELEVD